MGGKSMTALVCAFSRAYHSKTARVKISEDNISGLLLSGGEYAAVAENMVKGAPFFLPGCQGSPEEILRRIVDSQLSPTVLGRDAFIAEKLKAAAGMGVSQYIIFGAGYDTFAYRAEEWAKGITVFELDRPETAEDKEERVRRAGLTAQRRVFTVKADLSQNGWAQQLLLCRGYSIKKPSAVSLPGLVYYLDEDSTGRLIAGISAVTAPGSIIMLDYPDADTFTQRAGERAKKQLMLAGGAGERMLCGYTPEHMRELLLMCGFEMCENLLPDEITERYFSAHNKAEPEHMMSAFDNTNYCMARRK